MKALLIAAAAAMLAVSSASAEDAWTKLRNASANELCWDASRGMAREKYPDAGAASLTEVSLKRPAAASAIREGRKAFPGIRAC